ncbi:30S ribosomal protein S8 [Candidatus Dojkabacteria bacterium]|uniref:Small ribosomal subunit protein uS8 n=1 Tax=Candidatus Dojkabacteria bacterium TaxID=2099670 RepID=A0A847VDA6_9BACT|nr:30S ribosomal protein S8 [Candidatus Dojkabacteria bacterium]
MNDLTADLLTRIKNGILREKEEVLIPNTKMNVELLKVLRTEEMIGEVTTVDEDIKVELLYNDTEPVISTLKRVSKPGQRIYVSAKEIKPVMNGRGISVISTSKGLMTGAQAKSQNIGGELICEVW